MIKSGHGLNKNWQILTLRMLVQDKGPIADRKLSSRNASQRHGWSAKSGQNELHAWFIVTCRAHCPLWPLIDGWPCWNPVNFTDSDAFWSVDRISNYCDCHHCLWGYSMQVLTDRWLQSFLESLFTNPEVFTLVLVLIHSASCSFAQDWPPESIAIPLSWSNVSCVPGSPTLSTQHHSATSPSLFWRCRTRPWRQVHGRHGCSSIQPVPEVCKETLCSGWANSQPAIESICIRQDDWLQASCATGGFADGDGRDEGVHGCPAHGCPQRLVEGESPCGFGSEGIAK